MVGGVGSAADAAACQRPPIPRVIAKDAVGLGNDMPPFDIIEVGSIGFACLDVPWLSCP